MRSGFSQGFVWGRRDRARPSRLVGDVPPDAEIRARAEKKSPRCSSGNLSYDVTRVESPDIALNLETWRKPASHCVRKCTFFGVMVAKR
jgi:hypothetical protein